MTAPMAPRRSSRPPVLVHLTTQPEYLGWLSGQLRFMRESGFEVHAISSPGEPLFEIAAREGIRGHAIDVSRRLTPFRDARTAWSLVRLLRRIRPTIVHAHMSKGGILGMTAAAAARVPIRIYHNHGMALFTATGARRGLLCWSERTACGLAHRVLTVSPSVRDEIVRRGLCPAGRIQVPHNGTVNGIDAQHRFNPARAVEGDRFGVPPGAPVVGFVGRLLREKGVEELLTACERLRTVLPDLHLILAGRTESHDPLSVNILRKIRSAPWIRAPGHLQDPVPVYQAADVIALPSYREGFGLAAAEASAMGKPVVATRVPGCVDAVEDGRTGLLVPPGKVEPLASALLRYLQDPALRREHGRQGRRRILERFRPEDVRRATLAVYRELLERHHRGSASHGGTTQPGVVVPRYETWTRQSP